MRQNKTSCEFIAFIYRLDSHFFRHVPGRLHTCEAYRVHGTSSSYGILALCWI